MLDGAIKVNLILFRAAHASELHASLVHRQRFHVHIGHIYRFHVHIGHIYIRQHLHHLIDLLADFMGVLEGYCAYRLSALDQRNPRSPDAHPPHRRWRKLPEQCAQSTPHPPHARSGSRDFLPRSPR